MSRQAAEKLVDRALQLVVDTIGGDGSQREYTDDELEEMIFCLTMAAAKFKQLPGGHAAAERVYANAKSEQERRTRARRETEEKPETD
ncbi:MAG: hypothetical protein ACREJC_05900 [Tepidisphaeraceae bacterium]